jgi:predicted ester cyclase
MVIERDALHAFAQKLMDEVWRPFNSSAMSHFYHLDVVGYHRRADGSTQELNYADVANRLDRDKQTSANAIYDIRDIISESDKFTLRFIYTADFRPTGRQIDVEVWYVYQLEDGKVAEFWTVSSADCDYKARASRECPRNNPAAIPASPV